MFGRYPAPWDWNFASPLGLEFLFLIQDQALHCTILPFILDLSVMIS